MKQISRDIKDPISGTIQITGSKSETNRLLILQQMFPNLDIENISNSMDSQLMQKALASDEKEIYIGHAGTAMRFLTSYFASQPGRETILTGSERMKNRPIGILVDALRSLGANIQYAEKEGYPPLLIKGKELTESYVKIDGHVSSQYITSLLMMGAKMKNGLTIEFIGKVTSVPYIEMTLALLEQLGISSIWEANQIKVISKPEIVSQKIIVESDWSSASYYFSLIALNPSSSIKLS